MASIPDPELRKLKARAQTLEATFKVGKAGLSDGFVKSVDEGLAHHDLVKVKFVEFKDEKKTLAPALAEKTSSHLIMRVGNVAVYYRAKATAPESAHGDTAETVVPN
ncbi:MAG TPA: YhbY family RNA-binding protein [Verrucomicrobiae bacterium]|jgi:RNA-binding protein|nr:YhbY family RNA-binding protein [Verrucomicrobiae bacterium]